MPEKSIRDALKLAQKDAAFATDLVKNPKITRKNTTSRLLI